VKTLIMLMLFLQQAHGRLT